MKKSVYPRKNNFTATGIIVAEDAKINAAGTVAHFRMAVSSSKDTPSVFFDCVMFAKKDKPIPADLLKKGTKVEVSGYFHMNTLPATEQYPNPKAKLELVVTEAKENVMVEIEVEDAQAPAAVASQTDNGDMPADIADGIYADLPEAL